MKIESIQKGMVVGIALLIGIAVCVSLWFFLREQPSRALPAHESASREPQSVFPTDNKSLTENETSCNRLQVPMKNRWIAMKELHGTLKVILCPC